MSVLTHPAYTVLARVALGAAVICSVFVIRDAASPAASYYSAYDGRDPGDCALGKGNAGPIGAVAMKAADGNVLGNVRLIESAKCASMWPQFVLTPTAEKATLGRAVVVSVIRPADNATIPFIVPLKGGPNGRYGYGNMLGGTACVRATAQLLAGEGKPAGPVAQTKCLGG